MKRPRADLHGRIQYESIDKELRGYAFYYDVIHPEGNTGHRIMAELAAQLILDAYAQVSLLVEQRLDAASNVRALCRLLPHTLLL